MNCKALYLLAGLAGTVMAAPSNTPTLDGHLREYDAGELRGTYTGGGGSFGAGNSISNVFVTWDATYLYVALEGTETDNKLVLLIDVDPGAGTGAETTTNWVNVTPDYIRYNDVGWRRATNAGATPFGLDYQVASEGFFNSLVRVLYNDLAAPDTSNVEVLFDAGNGSNPLGTPVDLTVYSDPAGCDPRGIEARIPWSVLYPASGRFGTVLVGDTVPMGASLRLLATLHNNNPGSSYSSSDVIPQQTSPHATFADGLLTSDTYLDVLVDADSDGQPDLAPGDLNAPQFTHASGVAGQRQLFAAFNEPLAGAATLDPTHWRVGNDTPDAVSMPATNAVLLTLTNDLPAAGSLVLVAATNVPDVIGNRRPIAYCFSPAASGLTNALTVRFVLETASGLGLNPGASNYFINGGSYPLAFGYPPATSAPLAVLGGTLHYLDVLFPPGTPATLSYKYSGQLANTGTNNYEAVRLADYASAARVLTLPVGAASLTITDHLGAAAAPWRPATTNTFYSDLYADGQRGAAGVRARTVVKFQLDLSQRNRSGLARVILQGSDPLRGFNLDGTLPVGVSDYAGSGAVGWTLGGLTLFDDGTHGDTNANDGIYALDWAFTPDGQDTALVPDAPNSLVGGDFGGPPPFFGAAWIDQGSPRSVAYKFYLLRNDSSVLESPAANLELYLQPTTGTNLVLSPFLWDNNDLPPPPPSNAPALRSVSFTNGTARVVFTNVTTETQHGVQLSTHLAGPWLDFGHRANGAGTWTAVVQGASSTAEHYRAFAGMPQAFRGVRVEPNPLPATGGTLRITYRQHNRGLAGDRAVQVAGTFSGWNPVPMTFTGDGTWIYDAAISEASSTNIEFKPRNLSGSTWEGVGGGGDNYRAYKGYGRATWTPNSPTNGELLTIQYDAAGTPLATASTVNAWVWFDENAGAAGNRAMTNLGGSVWTLGFPVPTNAFHSVDLVFNSAGLLWDSENDNTGRANRIFITPTP